MASPEADARALYDHAANIMKKDALPSSVIAEKTALTNEWFDTACGKPRVDLLKSLEAQDGYKGVNFADRLGQEQNIPKLEFQKAPKNITEHYQHVTIWDPFKDCERK
jgi:hypothetical protein